MLSRLLFLSAAAIVAFGAPKLDYGRDIRPILSENCFHCHGQDSPKRMANLRLDTFEGATAKAALVPGKPDSSGLYQRITAEDKNRRMPPASSNRSLTPAQVATLKRWIEEGGTYSRHWAFIPPVRPAVPAGEDAIGYLVSQSLAAEGLKLSTPASPETWLRRATLDLTGLPPTLAELDAFAAAPDYEQAVSRLLASPRYGERMAMDWLDVARYADTHGFNNDSARSMWRWRDWVIQSFNANLRYNRFLTEQLAGDLLPHATLDQRIATGFGRNHVINSEGGIIEEEYRVEYVADRVRTLGMAWLGLTLECARCHDHKYDPITQRDHYQFHAFFNNVPELGEDGRVANAVPLMPAPTAAQETRLKQLGAAMVDGQRTAAGREANWRWRKSSPAEVTALARGLTPPAGAVLELGCETAGEFTLVEGVAGQACTLGAARPLEKAVPVGSRQPLTLSTWVQPGAGDSDAPLFSAIDYARSMASVRYGAGIELRLSGGELEFRFGQRYPAYSIRVQSEGASLSADQWRHVALVYSGDANDPAAMRAPASWVRMFVDGREVPVRILNDGAPLGGKTEKPTPTRFRVGWDNRPQSAHYTGRLDEAAFFDRALTPEQIGQLFWSRALPYAAARLQEKKASATETAWLRTALLRQQDVLYAAADRAVTAARAERLALEREVPTVMVMGELSPQRQTYLLKRGAYDMPGEKVEPAVPEDLLGAWPAGAPRNRLGLAQWLTKPDHPLTARVVVNRFWQQLFGQGLVKSSENFGVQGDSPSHPELLDWLAREFIDSGWDVKALLKRMVLSPVYRQDSALTAALLARDPENRLLARGPRVRLPAESIRDQALLIAGLLSERLGGPSVYPYQPADLYKGIVVAADYPGTNYILSQGADLYRRSLYTFWKRTVPHPTMTVFDAPDREFCIVRRSSTNTPLQALTLLNDPIFVEAARKLAERAIHEGGTTADGRLRLAFRLATGRAPDGQDLGILRQTLEQMQRAYAADEKSARAFLSAGASALDGSIAVSELAAYTAITTIILNLDETITKG